jgi:hypothetical protein
MRERLDRAHEEAQELIAESYWLRLRSRELLDCINRPRRREEQELPQVAALPPEPKMRWARLGDGWFLRSSSAYFLIKLL